MTILLSASSAKLLQNCERAYYIKTKLKIPIDWQPPWLDFGVRVHKVIETGEPDEDEQVNLCAYAYKCAWPEKPDFVEVKFSTENATGAVDVIVLHEDGTAGIVDIKTCSKWTKRELTDYQANLYISVWPVLQKQLNITHELKYFEWREIQKKTFKTKATRYEIAEFKGIQHQNMVDYAEALCSLDEIPEPKYQFGCTFCLWKDTCKNLGESNTDLLSKYKG